MSELHKVYPAFMDVSFDQVDFEKSETDSDSRCDNEIDLPRNSYESKRQCIFWQMIILFIFIAPRNNSASKFKGIIVPKLSASFSTLTSSTPEKNSNTPTRLV